MKRIATPNQLANQEYSFLRTITKETRKGFRQAILSKACKTDINTKRELIKEFNEKCRVLSPKQY